MSLKDTIEAVVWNLKSRLPQGGGKNSVHTEDEGETDKILTEEERQRRVTGETGNKRARVRKSSTSPAGNDAVRRWGIRFIGVIILAIVITALSQMLVDEKAYQQKLDTILKSVAGLQITVDGDAEVSLMPVPKVMMRKVSILAPGETRPLITADAIEAGISLDSLFASDKKISSLTLVAPVISVRKGAPNPLALLSADKDAANPLRRMPLSVRDGQLIFQQHDEDSGFTLKQINGDLQLYGDQGSTSFQGSVGFPMGVFEVKASTVPQQMSGNQILRQTLRFQATSEDTDLLLEGHLLANNRVPFQGNLILKTKNLMSWKNLVLKENGETEQTAQKKDVPKVSMDITGKAFLQLMQDSNGQPLKVGVLREMTINSAHTRGKGQAAIYLRDIPAIAMQLEMTEANIDVFRGGESSGNALLDTIKKIDLPTAPSIAGSEDTQAAEDSASGTEETQEKLPSPQNASDFKTAFLQFLALPRNVNFTVALNTLKATYQGQTIKNLRLNASLMGGNLTINSASAILPGEARLQLAAGSRKEYKDVNFEGNVLINGQNLSALLRMMPRLNQYFPQQKTFGRFNFKTNFLLTPQEFRLSELSLAEEKMQLRGSLIAIDDSEAPKLQTSFSAQGINFDDFIEQAKANHAAIQAGTEEQIPFSLIGLFTNVSREYTINARVADFIWKGKKGNALNLLAQLTSGNCEIRQLLMDYDEMKVAGKANLSTSAIVPQINATLRFSDFRMENWLRLTHEQDAMPAEQPVIEADISGMTAGSKWPRKRLNLAFLNYMNGQLDLTFDRLRYYEFGLDNLNFKGTLDAGKLDFENVKSVLWGGDVTLSGSVTGGEVPSIGLNYVMRELDANLILRDLFNIKNIYGRISATGNFTSSGVDVFSLVSNMQGNVRMAGRDVTLNGFDLPSLARTVSAVRTQADISNITRLSLDGGKSIFNRMTSNIFIQDGQVNITEFTLQSPIANAILTGTVDMPPWNMQTRLTVSLVNHRDRNFPNFGLLMNGTVDSPDTQLETTDLERYILLRSP